MWNETEKTLTNATIITVNKQMEVIENGYLSIKGNAISAIGEGKPKHHNNLIDCSGKILMPGFVNAHTHLAMTNYRGLADDLPLMEWLEEHIWPAEAKNNNEAYVRNGAKLGLQEMINTGTTTFADMYFFADAIAEETEKFGIRGIMNEGILDFPTNSYDTPNAALKKVEKFIHRWKGNRWVIPNLIFHATYTCSKETIKKIKELADKYKLGVHTHLFETETERQQIKDFQKEEVMELLDEIGLLNKHFSIAHGVWLNDTDQQVFADNDISIVHCPSSNLKLGSGIAPIHNYMNRGINVALGTDGCASNNNLDMVEEMRLAALLHKGANRNPELITAKQALRMATINGAKAFGLDDKIGSLEVGKLADLIVINTNHTFMQPIYDYHSAIVYSMNSSCIESVIVDGEKVK